MSRIRVLNLPKNLTDPEVRKHFSTGLPPNAPRDMSITDVFIKRDRDDPAVTRMLFVGFKMAAAGQFAASYFDGAYLRTSKIKVELASGLNDAPLPYKERQEQRKREREEKDKAWAEKKRIAVEGEQPDESKGPRVESAKDAFVKARLESGKHTASWASDLLLPDQPADATAAASSAAEQDDGFNTEGKREHARAADKRVAAEKLAKLQTLVKDAAAEQQEEGGAEAIPKEALNEVSDFDFLASLGGSGDAPAPTPTAPPVDFGVQPDYDNFDDDDRRPVPSQRGVGGSYSTGSSASVGAGGSIATATMSAEGEVEGGESQSDLPPAKKVVAISEEEVNEEEIVKETRRIRIGNLPFVARESEVRNHVTTVVGPIEHIHIPLTHDTKESKGAAFVTFVHVCDALDALKSLKGAVFMGRLLRVSAATVDPHSLALSQRGGPKSASMFEEENTGATLREKKAAQQKKADQKGLSWNATYMSASAAVQGMADKLNVDATQIVSIDERGAAVRAAVAEAFLTSEAKAILSDEGIDFDVLQEAQRQGGALHKARSKTTILVKNLNSNQTKDAGYLAELIKLFKRFGTIENVAAPSSRLFALFNFLHPQDARAAFQRLSYRKFNGLPLFLEWAPLGSLRDEADDEDESGAAPATTTSTADANAEPTLSTKMQVFSLYMSNLPMKGNDDDKKKKWLTEDKVRAFILEYCPKVARSPEKYIKAVNPRGERGQAFITCIDADAQSYILARLNGKPMDGRNIKVEVSRSAAVAAVADQNGHFEEDLTKEPEVQQQKTHTSCPPDCNPHKVVVKNLPFEATEKDLRELFASFSDIKSVRVPQKIHRFGAHRENNHRGFGFVEFLTEQEAASALKLLSSTHLYGRHLVLQYAKNEQ